MYELIVKEEDIEKIKKMGAIYDQEVDKWFVPENLNPVFFANWLDIHFLNVPFSEKEEAKKLGAKFDFKVKKWYIKKSANVNNFSKWLTLEKQMNIIEDSSKEKETAIKLSDLLTQVSFVVRKNFTRSVWVKCEIASLNKHSSGHVYLELLETDSNGREICKNRAMIVKSEASYLLEKFKIATDSDLKSGIKALFLIQVDFTPKFGLSLRIVDLDPKYTLGGIEEKILKIRNSLIKQKVYENNKLLKEPKEFTRVAVVSPNEAAGLGDFKTESDWLEKYGLCKFDYYSATFQGNGVNESVYNAIKEVHNYSINNNINYDVIAIIRGGGAKTDLHFLNEYDISMAICESKIPVFVGIGHERDKVILDEVANKSFDTPSKVANHIANVIINNCKEAINNLDNIKQESNKLVLSKFNEMKSISDYVYINSRNLLISKENLKDKMSSFIKEIAFRFIQYRKDNIMKDCQNIIYNSKNILNNNKNNSDILFKNVISYSKLYYSKELNSFYLILKDIDKYNTNDILKMGFSLVKKDGKIITSSNELNQNDEVFILFKDGSIKALIKGE